MNPWLWFPLAALFVLLVVFVTVLTIRIMARSKVPRVDVTPPHDSD